LLCENTDLTSKEWAFTALVSDGSTNADIAASIQAPEPMVKVLLRRILEKTGCWNRVEIALWYLEKGVQRERRFADRREADSISEGRQKGRRRTPERSRRSNEQHAMNLDE